MSISYEKRKKARRRAEHQRYPLLGLWRRMVRRGKVPAWSAAKDENWDMIKRKAGIKVSARNRKWVFRFWEWPIMQGTVAHQKRMAGAA